MTARWETAAAAVIRPPYVSTRQRLIVLTFETPEAAAAWDDAGQSLTELVECEVFQ